MYVKHVYFSFTVVMVKVLYNIKRHFKFVPKLSLSSVNITVVSELQSILSITHMPILTVKPGFLI